MSIEDYKKALAKAQQAGDKPEQERQLRNLGWAYRQENDIPQALSAYNNALTIAQSIGDQHNTASRLQDIAFLYSHSIKDLAQAKTYSEKALTIARNIESDTLEANILRDLGDIYHRQSAYDQAKQYFQEALDIAQRISDPRNEANRHYSLAKVALDEKDCTTLKHHISHARAIYTRLNLSDRLDRVEKLADSAADLCDDD